MADITINITFPVLSGADKFKYRYRLLPSGAYTAYADTFTNSFVISGLAVGNYEIEYIYVKEDEMECNPVLGTFQIVDTWDCIEFDVDIVFNTGSRPYIDITYTLLSPPTNPPCGYLITWIDNVTGQSAQTAFSSLPLSNELFIYFPTGMNATDTFTVIIQADLCNGKYIDCFRNEDITPSQGGCTPMALGMVSIILISSTPLQYQIDIAITQSTPPSGLVNITYQQTNLVTSGLADSGIASQLLTSGAGAPDTLSFIVNPNINYVGNSIDYSGSVEDICGNTHAWTVQTDKP